MNLRSPCASAIVALSLVWVLAGGVGAQSSAYRVELVSGSCAEPGALVASLAAPPADGDLAGAPAELEAVASALGATVALALDVVPVTLADIVATGHAVQVFERARPPGRLVACGEFGAIDGDIGDLQLGLAGTGEPGLHGVVWLRDNTDGTTSASVVIAEAGPVTAASGNDGIEVAIRKSLYLPNPLEIPVGTTVTWVNEDALPHTTTATDGAFDSGYMALDDRYSFTFDAPGEHAIYCVFHPRMRALVIVT